MPDISMNDSTPSPGNPSQVTIRVSPPNISPTFVFPIFIPYQPVPSIQRTGTVNSSPRTLQQEIWQYRPGFFERHEARKNWKRLVELAPPKFDRKALKILFIAASRWHWRKWRHPGPNEPRMIEASRVIDCSSWVNEVYIHAGMNYPYRDTEDFLNTDDIDTNEHRWTSSKINQWFYQDPPNPAPGDIVILTDTARICNGGLQMPRNAHMGIYLGHDKILSMTIHKHKPGAVRAYRFGQIFRGIPHPYVYYYRYRNSRQ